MEHFLAHARSRSKYVWHENRRSPWSLQRELGSKGKLCAKKDTARFLVSVEVRGLRTHTHLCIGHRGRKGSVRVEKEESENREDDGGGYERRAMACTYDCRKESSSGC